MKQSAKTAWQKAPLPKTAPEKAPLQRRIVVVLGVCAVLAAALVLLIGVKWASTAPSRSAPRETTPHARSQSAPAKRTAHPLPAHLRAVVDEQGVATDEANDDVSERLSVPPKGTRQAHRRWLCATYGAGEDQLGKEVPEIEGEIRPPQSFAVTAAGELLVLDSMRFRLVWFDEQGRYLRAAPFSGLARPADVGVAADGTIVLQDHDGLHTNGMLMLDATGERVVAAYPERQAVTEMGMYVVGQEVFFDSGLTSRKAAGVTARFEGPPQKVYSDEAGVIPGRVGPDGETILLAGIDNTDTGDLFVTAMRGKEPEHLYSTFLNAGTSLLALPFFQTDAQGRAYVVLDAEVGRSLLCLDAKGNPVGHAALPPHRLSDEEAPYRSFTVLPEGGLLYRVLSDDASTFEWFDCH
ncbi:MAG: hypothetical protein GX146_02580 [Myxococcales bacterium]|nr:hypothetical protein [Myxococcales bacterium]